MRNARSLLGLAVVTMALGLPGCCLCKAFCPSSGGPEPGVTPSPIRVPGLVKVMKNTPIIGTVRVGYEFDNGSAKWLVTTPGYGSSLGLNVDQSLILLAILNPVNPETGMPMVVNGTTLCNYANTYDPSGKPWTLHVIDPETTVGGPATCP